MFVKSLSFIFVSPISFVAVPFHWQMLCVAAVCGLFWALDLWPHVWVHGRNQKGGTQRYFVQFLFGTICLIQQVVREDLNSHPFPPFSALWGRTVRCALAVRKLGCLPPLVATGPRALNSAPYSATAGTPGIVFSEGPEFCTPCCFELVMHASVGGWFSGVFPG